MIKYDISHIFIDKKCRLTYFISNIMHNEVVIALQKDNEVIIVTDMAVQISTKEALYFKIITVQQITSFLNYQDFG